MKKIVAGFGIAAILLLSSPAYASEEVEETTVQTEESLEEPEVPAETEEPELIVEPPHLEHPSEPDRQVLCPRGTAWMDGECISFTKIAPIDICYNLPGVQSDLPRKHYFSLVDGRRACVARKSPVAAKTIERNRQEAQPEERVATHETPQQRSMTRPVARVLPNTGAPETALGSVGVAFVLAGLGLMLRK